MEWNLQKSTFEFLRAVEADAGDLEWPSGADGAVAPHSVQLKRRSAPCQGYFSTAEVSWSRWAGQINRRRKPRPSVRRATAASRTSTSGASTIGAGGT